MSANILNLTSNDLDVLTNKIFKLNKDLDKQKEEYKVELLEMVDKENIKICYVHDCYENNVPKLKHHSETVGIKALYQKIEERLYNQNLFKLETKELDKENSLTYQVNVMLHDECVHFQVEETKLQSYIKIYDWAVDDSVLKD